MTSPTNSSTTPPSVPRDDLVRWLNAYLRLPDFQDYSNNGLQVEGKPTVSRVAVSVDTSLRTLQDAADAGADLLIAHHGLFWNAPVMVAGPHKRRVQAALEADLNVYAAHLPLDAHPEVGNSAVLGQALGLQNVEGFAFHRGHFLGVKGELPFALTLQDLADRLQKITGEICLVHGGGPGEARKVGIVSGSGAGYVVAGAHEGLDTVVTGEPEHKHFYDSFENSINAIFVGHYESEVFGVRALAAKIEDEFGLPWQFIHAPTGL